MASRQPGTLLGPDAELVLGEDEDSLVGAFNRAGVLAAADVHVARVLARLGGEQDASVVLAAALAVRAPRAGHVLAELSTLRETVTAEAVSAAIGEGQAEADLSSLPWPELPTWLQSLARSPLVANGPLGGDDRPLRLVGSALYLDRYWRDEQAVAADLKARSRAQLKPVDEAVMAGGLARLFPGAGAAAQRQAAAGGPPPLVALAAPTGKAAARMAEAVHAEAGHLDVADEVRRRLFALEASTVHRLLGRQPTSSNRFRHHADNHLPHDVVVIDEASMMSLPLMARLVEAVRPDARLVLVGDHRQLASVEAGAVFGDIVGPAGDGAPVPPGPEAAGLTVPPRLTVLPPGPMASSITLLEANYRFSGSLAQLAAAIHDGDGDGVMAVLSDRREGHLEPVGAPLGTAGVRWLPVDAATAGPDSTIKS